MSRSDQYGYMTPSRSGMSILESGLTLLGGLAIGAGLMYLLDPEEGPSRRRYIRESAGDALHGVGDLVGSAYDAVSDSASSLRDRASDLTDRASRSARSMSRRSQKAARDYAEDYGVVEDEGMGTGSIIGLVLGGCAAAAVLYILTTEYDRISRGEFRDAFTDAYSKASDAVTNSAQYVRDTATDVANRTSSYFTGGQQQDQSGRQPSAQSQTQAPQGM